MTLSFASSPWHLFTALIAFIAGLAFCFNQKKLFDVPIPLAIALYTWHTAFCILYFYYAITDVADSTRYYTYSLYYFSELSLGTNAVTALTSIFSRYLSMSYGGVFLIYNLFGFVGVIALASAFRQVTAGSKTSVQNFALIVLFLPGLSFWSSSIGKDALTFMSAGLACWAALNLHRRYPAMAISILVFLVARPHIAGILVASLALTAVLFLKTGFITKLFITILAIPLAIAAAGFGLEFAGVADPASVEAISDRIESQQGRNLGGGSSVSISDMSIPLRLFTYLFRPLIFDANGFLGLVVSVENVILLSIACASLASMINNKGSLSRFQLLFFFVFSAATLMVLANTTANLGISIRQKWMFVPMLLTVALSYLGRPKMHISKARIGTPR